MARRRALSPGAHAAAVRAASFAACAALLVWLIEGAGYFIAGLLVRRGHIEGKAVTEFLCTQDWLYQAQWAAAALLIATSSARITAHAPPIAPLRFLWLPSCLGAVLLGATCYLSVVAIVEFEHIRVEGIEPVYRPRDSGKPIDRKLTMTEESFNPAYNTFRYRQASAEIGLVIGLQIFSAAWLLYLQVLALREGLPAWRRSPERRVPPWRLARGGGSAILGPFPGGGAS